MITDKICKYLTAYFAASIALITYAITVAPTVSFWDCGEFIASAYTLGIPHPPGRPFYILFVRAVMVCLPMVEEIAKRANYISAFASSATVFMVVIFIWDLLSNLVKNATRFILAAASLSGALLLTFADTFWFNAVESEVYNLIMFITLLISYIGLKYYYCQDEGQRNRYLVFICYLAFLGVGFHLFAMLIIPAVFILVLLSNGRPLSDLIGRWPLWISGTVLCSIVYAISNFLTWALILLAVLFVAWIAAKKSPFHKDISISLALTIVALIGFSTHLYIPIRSALNPTINENSPQVEIRDSEGNLKIKNLWPSKENWPAFYDYLERKQYGSESMISRSFYRRSQPENQFMVFPHMGYGGWQIAQYTPFKPGEVSYWRQGVYSIDSEDNMPVVRGPMKFPTLMMSIGENRPFQAILFLIYNGLLLWIALIAFRSNKTIGIYIALLYLFSSAGLLWYLNFADGTRPERRDYDMWAMQMKYYTKELASAGMLGAISIPDPNELLNIQREIYRDLSMGKRSSPAEQKSAWQKWKAIQSAIQSAFGASAQALPLPDPVHLEVRNRDYFYSPAFVFMSLLYGLGIGFGLVSIQKRRGELLLPSGIAIAVLCGAIPLFANYKEHNRGNLWVPWDYAYNLLMSCEPNAILFTNGDNDTFPLWFAQEVAGIRKDVRVVNLSLGNTDWYIKQMLENEPILKLSYDKAGIDRDMVLSENNYAQSWQGIEFWVNTANERITTLSRQVEILESRLDSAITAFDSAKINEDLNKRKLWLQTYTALKNWGEPRKGGTMQTQYKLVIDLTMNNIDRPIHVSTTVGLSNAVGLDKYMVQKGMIWDLAKGTLNPSKDSMDINRTAYLIDSVFKYRGLGDSTTYLNYETERLLFNYNQMYIRMAMAMRDSLVLSPKSSRILENGLRYVDMGIKQFPSEWRNYAVASELLLFAGDDTRAIEYLEKGLSTVPESSGSRYLLPQLSAIKGNDLSELNKKLMEAEELKELEEKDTN
ncbi:MAG: DUF2723 domain-containing protein [Fibromonadaceae bacterium]|jgi:hypothetical protein|nr:DUF2723 domain-containing protein [Fibromonadaceae bacterium]